MSKFTEETANYNSRHHFSPNETQDQEIFPTKYHNSKIPKKHTSEAYTIKKMSFRIKKNLNKKIEKKNFSKKILDLEFQKLKEVRLPSQFCKIMKMKALAQGRTFNILSKLNNKSEIVKVSKSMKNSYKQSRFEDNLTCSDINQKKIFFIKKSKKNREIMENLQKLKKEGKSNFTEKIKKKKNFLQSLDLNSESDDFHGSVATGNETPRFLMLSSAGENV